MTWDEFYKSVREARFERVYLFTGPEEYNKREALCALRRALLPAGLEALNDATLEGVGARAIIDSAETLPVMCDRRVVVVRDWAPLVGGKTKADEAEAAKMLEWLADPPESCVLLFYMTQEMKGQKKLVGALSALAGHVRFDYLGGALLQKWCAQFLKPFEKTLRPDALNEMTLMAGQDLTRLSSELKKLSAYVGDRPEIEIADVRAIVTPLPEYSALVILDHLFSGRLTDAVQTANGVLQADSNAVRLIGLFASQLRTNMHVKYAQQAGDAAAALKALAIPDWRLKYIQRQCKNLSADALKRGYLMCADADYAIKSGRVRDRAALDELLLRLSSLK